MNMKTILALLAAACTALTADAAKPAAPKGGRLLENTTPQAELVIGPDRFMTINFYDANMKSLPADAQIAVVIAEAGDQKRGRIAFQKKDGALVSKTPLPAGSGYPVIVRLNTGGGAETKDFKFDLSLESCTACKLARYACTCPKPEGGK